MAFLALNELDEEISSFQCRDEYIRNDTVYEAFRCPYCEMPYYSKNIYKDGVVGKAPHFSLYPKTRHVGNCDGEPDQAAELTGAEVETSKVEKREFQLPEKLVERRPARPSTPGPSTERGPLDEDQIMRRRKDAGKNRVPARFTSSLLQTFVEGKNMLLRECFKKAKDAGLNPDKKKALLKEVVSAYPLDLFGQQLNYDNAFWGAVNARGDSATRIFHGDWASVTVGEAGFDIVTEPPVPGPSKVRAIVRFAGERDFAADKLSRAHARLIDALREAQSGKLRKWYAYGSMERTPDGGVRVLTLASLDHLFVEP